MRMRGGVCTVRWAVSLVKFGCRRRSGIQLLNSDSSGSNCFARASHFSDHLCLKTSNPFAPTVYLDLLHVEEVREETVKKLCGTLISPSTIAAMASRLSTCERATVWGFSLLRFALPTVSSPAHASCLGFGFSEQGKPTLLQPLAIRSIQLMSPSNCVGRQRDSLPGPRAHSL